MQAQRGCVQMLFHTLQLQVWVRFPPGNKQRDPTVDIRRINWTVRRGGLFNEVVPRKSATLVNVCGIPSDAIKR